VRPSLASLPSAVLTPYAVNFTCGGSRQPSPTFRAHPLPVPHAPRSPYAFTCCDARSCGGYAAGRRPHISEPRVERAAHRHPRAVHAGVPERRPQDPRQVQRAPPSSAAHTAVERSVRVECCTHRRPRAACTCIERRGRRVAYGQLASTTASVGRGGCAPRPRGARAGVRERWLHNAQRRGCAPPTAERAGHCCPRAVCAGVCERSRACRSSASRASNACHAVAHRRHAPASASVGRKARIERRPYRPQAWRPPLWPLRIAVERGAHSGRCVAHGAALPTGLRCPRVAHASVRKHRPRPRSARCGSPITHE
jgi:hypothetical protein